LKILQSRVSLQAHEGKGGCNAPLAVYEENNECNT
jgi:hypothetical protein